LLLIVVADALHGTKALTWVEYIAHEFICERLIAHGALTIDLLPGLLMALIADRAERFIMTDTLIAGSDPLAAFLTIRLHAMRHCKMNTIAGLAERIAAMNTVV